MQNRHSPHILLVNPWIHDYAAYDVWAKPMGLLLLGAVLRDHGFNISYIDCLDRFHPREGAVAPFMRHGRGPYRKETLPPPPGLENVPRRFSRYGIKPAWFEEDLRQNGCPDLILVTSVMTYWASGVQETIEAIKRVYPHVPVILGGIYATLCPEHAAQHAGAHEVVTGPGEAKILQLVEKYTGHGVPLSIDPDNLDELPYPAYDLQRTINYVPILTSRGCPFSCAYCASSFLNPRWQVRSPERVVEEIKYWHGKYHVRDFAFYDDALLIDAESHAVPIFEGIVKSELRLHFHTPNALHVRQINEKTADLMFRAGFKTLRLGLETVEFENREQLDKKVTRTDFERAVSCLKNAGFQAGQIGAYLLTGLPGQSVESVEHSVKVSLEAGITPVLTHYTPIPHTAMWQEAVNRSRYDLEKDPVFTNNALNPCSGENFSWDELAHIKKMISRSKRAQDTVLSAFDGKRASG